MIITKEFPYKLQNITNWVSNSGTLISSGDIQYINKAADTVGVDNTYIHYQSNSRTPIYFHVAGTGLPSNEHDIESVTLRVRQKITSELNPSITVSGISRFGLTGNNYYTQFIPTTLYYPHVNNFVIDKNIVILSQSGNYSSTSGWVTQDFNFYNTSKSFSSLKDTIFSLECNSGSQISSVSLLVNSNPSLSLGLLTLGYTSDNEAKLDNNEMILQHNSSYRCFGLDSTLSHPTGFFTAYDNFDHNGLNTAYFNVGTVFKSLNVTPVETYSIYNKPLSGVYYNYDTQVLNSGYPNNYTNLLYLPVSGVNRSRLYSFIAKPELFHNKEAWTVVQRINRFDTLTLGSILSIDSNSGQGLFNSSMTVNTRNFSFIYLDENHSYSQAIFNYDYNELLDKHQFFTVITSYSGGIIYNSGITNVFTNVSGTFNFYLEYNNSSLPFKHIGTVSTIFARGDTGIPKHVSLYNYISTVDFSTPMAISEIGIIPDYFISETGTFLQNQELNRFINSRRGLDEYISNSGDTKYINVKWNPQYEYSGVSNTIVNNYRERVEFIQFNIASGNPNYIQLVNPIFTDNGYVNLSPSSIYVEYLIDNHTNHPSGTEYIFNINGRYNSNSGVMNFSTILSSGSNHYGKLYFPEIYGFKEPIFYKNKGGTPEFDSLDFNLIIKQLAYPDNATDTNNNYRLDSNIKYVKLYLDNVLAAATGNDELTLYMSADYHDSFDLFIHGHESVNNNFTLFTSGPISQSGNLDLFIHGYSSYSGNMDLYIHGHLPSSGDVNLYINGHDVTVKSQTLYIKGPLPQSTSGNFTMFMTSTENSGMYKPVELYLDAQNVVYPYNSIPLYIKCQPISNSSVLPLYITNIVDSANHELDLFTLGPSGQYEEITFYVRGSGITDGSIPYNNNINLYIARENEDNTDERIQFYISGPVEYNNNNTLYIHGAYLSNSGIDAFIEGSSLPITSNIKLYSHGF